MFCKAPFTSLMGSLKHNISFKCSCIILVQLNTLEICQNIKMSDPYKSPVGRARWTPVGITLQNLPEESSSNNH